MRIAILIGISQYINCDNLPGCDNDIKAVGEVIKTSKEFDEIKIFSNNVNSNKLKSELATLFSELKGKNIEEIFFYFSGHGNFHNNEFYYILSDFDENKRRQTSLQNLEIDNMIKSIKPVMVTKVIDACQSGVSYIKGNNNVVEKYYSKTTESFNKCYFLHSSMTDQYSYQDDNLSDFTKNFLASIIANSKPTIRYKDIIDYISDEFEGSTEQTPFFITQADHTETFLSTSKEINQVLGNYFLSEKKELLEPEKDNVVKYNSYIDKIKKDAEIYSTIEEVKKLFLDIKNQIENSTIETDINELYDTNSSFENYLGDFPKRIEIARWLEDNKNNFFAEPKYERTSYEEEQKPNPFGGISSLLQGNKVVTKYRNTLIGFNQTVDLPYKSILINYIPKYPNLIQYASLITFLISKKDIKFFHSFTNYTEQDWNRKTISKNFKWQSTDFILKEHSEIISFIGNLMNDNENNISTILKKKFEIK